MLWIHCENNLPGPPDREQATRLAVELARLVSRVGLRARTWVRKTAARPDDVVAMEVEQGWDAIRAMMEFEGSLGRELDWGSPAHDTKIWVLCVNDLTGAPSRRQAERIATDLARAAERLGLAAGTWFNRPPRGEGGGVLMLAQPGWDASRTIAAFEEGLGGIQWGNGSEP